MSVTDNFAKLKEHVEKADRTVKAAAEQKQAEIQTKVDEARRDADQRAADYCQGRGLVSHLRH